MIKLLNTLLLIIMFTAIATVFMFPNEIRELMQVKAEVAQECTKDQFERMLNSRSASLKKCLNEMID